MSGYLHRESLAKATGRRTFARLICLAVFTLSGCTVGPKYARPSAEVPADYKEGSNWKPAQPSDALSKGKWWEIYQDPQLNTLEDRISVSNQNLKIAQAQFIQARAALKISRSGLFPTVTGNASAARLQQSQNRPLFNNSTAKTNYSDYTITKQTSGAASAAQSRPAAPKRKRVPRISPAWN